MGESKCFYCRGKGRVEIKCWAAVGSTPDHFPQVAGSRELVAKLGVSSSVATHVKRWGSV